MQQCSPILSGDRLEAFNYCHTSSGSKVMADTLVFRQQGQKWPKKWVICFCVLPIYADYAHSEVKEYKECKDSIKWGVYEVVKNL